MSEEKFEFVWLILNPYFIIISYCFNHYILILLNLNLSIHNGTVTYIFYGCAKDYMIHLNESVPYEGRNYSVRVAIESEKWPSIMQYWVQSRVTLNFVQLDLFSTSIKKSFTYKTAWAKDPENNTRIKLWNWHLVSAYRIKMFLKML